ncbi:MAG: hypothetical protein CL564_05595 [Alphaproteobacteria bacterium]|nr:hypothetical protein [Alphaproteobacteria bacterium]
MGIFMLKWLVIFMLFIINNNFSYAIDKKVKAELIPHCGMTKGGVATATPDGKIYYCPQRIANIDWNFPGAVDFFILHEYGHIVLQSGNELEVDCWTAYEFSLMKDKKSKKSIKEALKFIRGFKLPDPKYGGTGEDRALLIENCMKHGADFYKNN